MQIPECLYLRLRGVSLQHCGEVMTFGVAECVDDFLVYIANGGVCRLAVGHSIILRAVPTGLW